VEDGEEVEDGKVVAAEASDEVVNVYKHVEHHHANGSSPLMHHNCRCKQQQRNLGYPHVGSHATCIPDSSSTTPC